MRKPRDFDADLKALEDRARGLKTRKVRQLGELVIATGADTLIAEELAGALIVLAETKDAGKREAWARRGAAFFQSRARRPMSAAERHIIGAPRLPETTRRALMGSRETSCPLADSTISIPASCASSKVHLFNVCKL